MRRFRYFGFSLAFLCLFLSRTAQAQNVRYEDTPYGSLIRTADTAADKQNIAQWPHLLIGETGTQVHITFDLRNADVSLYTNYEFGIDRALQEARRIAPAIGCANADYILNHGTHTLCADIELNKYLHRQGKSATSFSLDLGAIANALKVSHLPKPIVFYSV